MTAPPAISRELATALAQARATGRPALTARRPATLEEAEQTAELLYDQLRGWGARQVGWKLGATDAAGQRRLGADRPFIAPVYDVMSAPLCSSVSLGNLVAPLLEVEIGVELGGGVPALRPCVEIADSRYPGWPSSLPEAIADFGLQGRMLPGAPVAPVAVVTAKVWHDGELRAHGTRTYADAVALARLAAERDGTHPAGFVATGTITPPVPLAVGHWNLDLGELGHFGFEVTP